MEFHFCINKRHASCKHSEMARLPDWQKHLNIQTTLAAKPYSHQPYLQLQSNVQNSTGKNMWFANMAVTGTRQQFKPTRNDKRRRETLRVGKAQLVEKSNLLIISCAFRIKHCLKLALIQPPWLTGLVKTRYLLALLQPTVPQTKNWISLLPLLLFTCVMLTCLQNWPWMSRVHEV